SSPLGARTSLRCLLSRPVAETPAARCARCGQTVGDKSVSRSVLAHAGLESSQLRRSILIGAPQPARTRLCRTGGVVRTTRIGIRATGIGSPDANPGSEQAQRSAHQATRRGIGFARPLAWRPLG